jgi:hypothetical protein
MSIPSIQTLLSFHFILTLLISRAWWSHKLFWINFSSMNQAGHTAVKFGDSILYIGGFGRLAESTSPVGVESAVSMRLSRARAYPICPFWEYTALPEYQGGVIQQSNPLANRSPCFRCLPGSRAVFGVDNQNQPVTGSAACQLCAAGTYSDVTGAGKIEI